MSLESYGGKMMERKLERGGEMPLDAFPVQMKIAEFAYMHRTEEENAQEPAPAKIDGNTVMRWWLKKGLAATYGQYLEEHPGALLNVHDEEQLAHIVDELRGDKNTLH